MALHAILGRSCGPRQYLDAQLIYELMASFPESAPRWSASVITPPSDTPARRKRQVFAVVCLVRFNRRDREGYIFGYKDCARCGAETEYQQ